MEERNTRKTKRDESIFEVEIKLVNPHRDLQMSEFCHWGSYRMFPGIKPCFMKVWKPLQLFYSERSRLWFFCLATCVHMVLIAYARSMPAYARARLCVPRFIRVSNSLSYLECGFLTKAFLMTSMA